MAESRSYFHFYINEEENKTEGKLKAEERGDRKSSRAAGASQVTCKGPRGIGSSGTDDTEGDTEEAGGHRPLKGLIEESKIERECAFLSHFNIPNFVSLEHSSALGEDDLPYEPSVILEH